MHKMSFNTHKQKSFSIWSKLFFLCLICILTVTFFSFKERKPLVSVVMSTYNRAELLPDAVNSILKQTLTDFEFIIINDGSTDNTQLVLEEFQKADSRIKIITNSENLGLVSGLNKGLAVAQGKYVARMDDDDISVPQRFELQVKFMEKNPDITVTGTEQQPQKSDFNTNISDVKIKISAPECHIISYYNVPILHPSAMIRTDFIKTHEILYDKRYISAEDTPFWHKIASKGGKIVQLSPPLVIRGESKKKVNYLSQQLKSFSFHLNTALKDIKKGYIFQPKWLDKTERCFILNQLLTENNQGFSQTDVKKMIKKLHCPTTSYLVLKNKNKSVLLEKKGNQFCSAQDVCFNVLQQTDDILVLESEKFKDRHLYRFLSNQWVKDVNNDTFYKISHPDWTDEFYFFGNSIVLKNKPQTPLLLSKNESEITLMWENKTTETFKNDNNTFQYLPKSK